MNSILTIILLAMFGSIIFGIVKALSIVNRRKAYLATHPNLTIKRVEDFQNYENYYYTTNLQFRTLVNKLVERDKFYNLGIEYVYEGRGEITFSNSGTKEILQKITDARDGKSRFYFRRIRSQNANFPDKVGMNELQTHIERIILQLDPNAEVIRRHAGFKRSGGSLVIGTISNAISNTVSESQLKKERATVKFERIPMINDYLNDPGFANVPVSPQALESSEVRTSQVFQGETLSALSNENAAAQKDWLEYFEMVNGRKPNADEFAQAKRNGEF
ncbi:hypothetical protein [Lactovum odontotermitis]